MKVDTFRKIRNKNRWQIYKNIGRAIKITYLPDCCFFNDDNIL